MSTDHETLSQHEGEAQRVRDAESQLASPSAAPGTSVAPLPSRPFRQSLSLKVFLGVAVLAALAFGVWCWRRLPPVEPPAVDLVTIDLEIAETVTAAREAVLSKPNSGATWGRLGMVFRAHDYGQEARTCLAEAERLDPQEPRWPYLWALTLLSAEPAVAIPHLERAADRCGDEPLTPRLRLAEALLDAGRLDEADRHLQQALAKVQAGKDPASTDLIRTHIDLVRLAISQSNWRAALEHLVFCVADVHTRKQALRTRAQIERRLGQFEKAATDETRAAELPDDKRWPDPFDDEAFSLQRGLSARLITFDLLRRSNRLDDAITFMEETTRKYPQSVLAWLHLAELWHAKQRLDRAADACLQALKADPNASQAWFWLGVFQWMQNRPREAAGPLREAIRLKPDHALAHLSLGKCLEQLRDPTGAAAEYRLTLRYRPGYEPARLALSQVEGRHPELRGKGSP